MVNAPILLIAALLSAPLPAAAADGLPAWAYPIKPPLYKPAPDDGTPHHVPDSAAGMTLSQVRDLFAAPDWHPKAHPPMPEVVARGRKPGVFACGFCHRAEGTGGPENASLAGLPTDYILQQMADYRSGARSTALPERIPQAWMIASAKAATPEELQQAAAYPSSLRPRRTLRVIESSTAPRAYAGNWILVRAGTAQRAVRRADRRAGRRS